MCLGQVVQVVALGDGAAADGRVDLDGCATVRHGLRDLTVSLLTLDEPVAVGDWLVVHSGFALERISAEQAQAALALSALDTPTSSPQPDVSPPPDQ